MGGVTAYYYVDEEPPEWWASIDVEAAETERWPDVDTLRRTERAQLGMLVTPAESVAARMRRLEITADRDADRFIARMEERTGIGAAHRNRLTELANERTVKRRDAWAQKMREKGYTVDAS